VRKSQAIRRIKWSLGAIVAGAGFAAATLAYTYLATHPLRRRVRLPDGEAWDVEDVEFPSRDGVRLSGWFVPAEGEPRGAVILCHGYPANRAEVLSWGRLLQPHGYHLLLFDFRAMGQSEGTLSTIGHLEVQDLLGASDYLHSRSEMEGLNAGVFGLSMGGAVALMAAAQDDRLKAVVTHGAYATLERAIDQRGRLILGAFGKALSRPAMWWGRRWMETHPREVSPMAAVALMPERPLLFFHGQKDRIVSPADGVALACAAERPDALRPLPLSYHVRVHSSEWNDYAAEFVAFFRTHL
jgi:uncharacterized protein